MQILWSVILGPSPKTVETRNLGRKAGDNTDLEWTTTLVYPRDRLEKIIKNASDKALIAKPIFGIFIIFKCDTIPIH